ncbi:MAG: sigma-70 family RNA polymerase sigma factor [Anaerocolumna sp.]
MGLSNNQRDDIEKLYQEMFYSMLAYAQNALNGRALAEEAVQDTFRIACAKAENLLSSPNPKGWLLNTLKHVIRNTIRSRAYLNRLVIASLDFDENISPEKEYIDDLKIDLLFSDLADDEDYKLIKKIALDKCTILEVAEELGISVEACHKRVQRAKKRLKKRIQ